MCKVKGQENFCEKERTKSVSHIHTHTVLAKCENIIINSKCKCSLMTLLCLYHPFLIWPIDNIYKFVFVTYERMLSAFNVVNEKWEQNSGITSTTTTTAASMTIAMAGDITMMATMIWWWWWWWWRRRHDNDVDKTFPAAIGCWWVDKNKNDLENIKWGMTIVPLLASNYIHAQKYR